MPETTVEQNDSSIVNETSQPSAMRSAYEARVLRDMSGSAIVIGPHGVVTYANEAACETFGIGPFVGKRFADFFEAHANPENDEFFELLLEAIRDKEQRFSGRLPFVSAEGKRYMFFVTTSLVQAGDFDSYLVVTCADVTAEEEAARMRRESTFVLLASIAFICSFIFIYAIWNYIGRPGKPSYLTRILEVGGLILGFFVFKKTSLSFSDLGLSTDNLAHNLKVDGIASLGIIACACVLKLVLMNVAPQLIKHPETFFQFGWVPISSMIIYVFTAIIQEFLTRGIMQESLLHILEGPARERTALIMSTIMFATLHLMYSPLFMAGAALMLSAFGVIYQKQRSIWGLALIHYTFGMSASLLGIV